MLQTVARFLDPWEAHIVCARLNAEDIPATVAFANHAIVDWPAALALGGTAVQVPADYAEQAGQLIADYRAGRLEAEVLEDAPAGERRCPRCGSLDIHRTVPVRQRWMAAVLGLFSATFPTRESEVECGKCGMRWGVADESGVRRTD
jgi:ribosomal protein S27AE